MRHTFIIAEIGINHNGDLEIAKEMIKKSKDAGADVVKFQKRTIDLVYTPEYLVQFRESPWGTTQRAQKEGLEFGKAEYDEIDRFCRELGIVWFASAWDMESQEFLAVYNLKYNKIASAMIVNFPLLEMVAQEGKHTFISSGMSTYEEIDEAVAIFRKHACPFELMHCNSTYPMKNEDANLLVIPELRKRYGCDVGYSGHEVGRIVSLSAVALGATSVERHVTLDRAMYGSDQAASIQFQDMARLIVDIRCVEVALGDGVKCLTESELATREKLRPGRVKG
jgi:N-acetylneuraminate synthase